MFVRDPKIAKCLGVKDFDYFSDHRAIVPEDVDPMFGKTLISLKGQKWRDMRTTLSPAFTGSKMRQMYSLMNDVAEQTAQGLKEEISKGGENSFEFKDLAKKIAVDVIATCAFGIQVDSVKNPENDFHRIASKVTDFLSAKNILKFTGYLFAPSIMKKLKVRLLDAESCKFFQNAIIDTMKVREQKEIVRNDMINLLMQAKKGQLASNEDKNVEGLASANVGQSRIWDDEDLAAQCFIFFLAGFETV